MTVPPCPLLWFGGFGVAKVGIKGTWSTTRSAFLSHSPQIIKSEVTFFFKVSQRIEHLSGTNLCYTQSADSFIYTHQNLNSGSLWSGGIIGHSFPF